MAIHFCCPSCKTVYTVDDAKAGKKSNCAKCGQRLQVPNPIRNKTILGEVVPEPQSSSHTIAGVPVTGPIRFNCPHCKAPYVVNRRSAGRSMGCKSCLHSITIPGDREPTIPPGSLPVATFVNEPIENESGPSKEAGEFFLPAVEPDTLPCNSEPAPPASRSSSTETERGDGSYDRGSGHFEPTGFGRDSRRPARGFDMGTALGTASLVVDVVTLLTSLAPCVWLFTLPMSGLGACLGLIGLIVSMRSKPRGSRGIVLSSVGMGVGLLLLLLSGLWVIYVQIKLQDAMHRMNSPYPY